MYTVLLIPLIVSLVIVIFGDVTMSTSFGENSELVTLGGFDIFVAYFILTGMVVSYIDNIFELVKSLSDKGFE